MRARMALGAAGVSALLLGGSAVDAEAESFATRHADVCIDFSASASVRISACTWMIANAGLDPINLAIAYNNRGVARQEAADLSGALADLTAACELHPSARAYFARAWVRCEAAWRADDRGNPAASRAAFALGEADMRRAIALDASIGSVESFCY